MTTLPPLLRALWSLGLLCLLGVLGVITARWAGAGRLTPPSGLAPLLAGIGGVVLGWRRPRLRLPAWGIGWGCLLWLAVDLLRIQAGLERPLPLPYLGLFLGLALLAPACAWQVRWEREGAAPTAPPTRG